MSFLLKQTKLFARFPSDMLYLNTAFRKIPKANQGRTRHSSARYTGLPSELPESDLPTYRQVIQFAYYLEKNNSEYKNIVSSDLMMTLPQQI